MNGTVIEEQHPLITNVTFNNYELENHDNYLLLTFFILLINFLISYFFYYSEKNYSKDDVISINIKKTNDLKHEIIKFSSFANFSNNLYIKYK